MRIRCMPEKHSSIIIGNPRLKKVQVKGYGIRPAMTIDTYNRYLRKAQGFGAQEIYIRADEHHNTLVAVLGHDGTVANWL